MDDRLVNIIRRGLTRTQWSGAPPPFLGCGGIGSMKDILKEHRNNIHSYVENVYIWPCVTQSQLRLYRVARA